MSKYTPSGLNKGLSLCEHKATFPCNFVPVVMNLQFQALTFIWNKDGMSPSTSANT